LQWHGDRSRFQSITSQAGSDAVSGGKRFQLLKLLILKAPRVLSRDEILNAIWGEDKFPSSRTVDNAVVRLRQDLGDSEGEWIRSVRGIGYQWAGEVQRE